MERNAGIQDVCRTIFGSIAWGDLDENQRRVVVADVDALATEEGWSHQTAAGELARRIGGSSNLSNYADVLLAGERRRKESGQ